MDSFERLVEAYIASGDHLLEYNPYHDEGGRFTNEGGAKTTVAYGGRQGSTRKGAVTRGMKSRAASGTSPRLAQEFRAQTRGKRVDDDAAAFSRARAASGIGGDRANRYDEREERKKTRGKYRRAGVTSGTADGRFTSDLNTSAAYAGKPRRGQKAWNARRREIERREWRKNVWGNADSARMDQEFERARRTGGPMPVGVRMRPGSLARAQREYNGLPGDWSPSSSARSVRREGTRRRNKAQRG